MVLTVASAREDGCTAIGVVAENLGETKRISSQQSPKESNDTAIQASSCDASQQLDFDMTSSSILRQQCREEAKTVRRKKKENEFFIGGNNVS